MGFHLIEKVYSDVKGTSPRDQAVLVYLAHRANDEDGQRCFPSYQSIVNATHFARSSVAEALNNLRDANLLTWKSGGRPKGGKGHSLANDYTLNLSNLPKSRVHRADSAVSTGQTLQSPQSGRIPVQQLDTNNTSHQPLTQPSINGTTDPLADDFKSKVSQIGERWAASPDRVRENADTKRERDEIKQRELNSLVDEALIASGCELNDRKNREIFSSTLRHRDWDRAKDVIDRFASECRQGEHKGLDNSASALNACLAHIPIVQ